MNKIWNILIYVCVSAFLIIILHIVCISWAGASFAQASSDSISEYIKTELEASKQLQGSTPVIAKERLNALEPLLDQINDPDLISKVYTSLGDMNLDYGNLDTAQMNLKKVHAIIGQLTDNFVKYDFYIVFGRLMVKEQHTDSAILYFEKALELAKSMDKIQLIAACYNNLGLVYNSITEYQKSYEYYFQAMLIFEESNQLSNLAITQNNLALVLVDLNQPEKAIELLKKAEALNIQLEEKYHLAMNYGNMGLVFEVMEQYDDAREMYLKSLQVAQQEGFIVDMARAYHNLGNIAFQQDKLVEAEEFFSQSLAITKKHQLMYGFMKNNFSLSILYNTQEKFSTALQYVDTVLILAKEHLDMIQEVDAYKLKASILENQDRKSEALKALKTYITLNDSLQAKFNRDYILDLQEKYESEKKDLENSRLSLENESKTRVIQFQKYISYAILTVLVLVLALLVSVVRSRRKISKTNQSLAQLNEEIQKQNISLAEVNATKDLLFSIIGHDLKSPFNVLLGFLRIVIENYDDLSEKEKKEILFKLYTHSNNTYTLIENLLQWSLSQRNQIVFTPVEINLQELVEAESNFLYSRAEKKGIQITNAIQPDTMIKADKNMVQTIIRNILNNSIKFTTLSGRIVVGGRKENNGIIISISDNGKGMTADEIQKIKTKQEFYSTDGTAGEKGSGLGLVIVNEFLRKHQGELSIESKPEEGTTFNIFLPQIS